MCLGIKSSKISPRLCVFYYAHIKMHNISLIEIKYCIWEKANTNGAE